MFVKIKMLCALSTIAATVAILACSVTQSAEASGPQPVQVGTCKSSMPSYTTIQAAVNAAAAGATVTVCPGTYPEQVTISKNLSLLGLQNGGLGVAQAAVIVPPAGGLVQNATDPSPSAVNPRIAAQIFVQGPATVNITNIVVDGANNNLSGCGSPTLIGIYYLNASGLLSSNFVRNEVLDPADSSCDSGLGIYLEAGSASTGGTGPTDTVNITTVTNYQKNGITANGFGNGSAGPVVSFWSNEVVGRGPTSGAVENGIQVGYGATGKVTLNMVLDDIWEPDTSGDPDQAATGILVYASTAVTVTTSKIGNTQFGIAVESDPTYGSADSNTITSNTITATQIFDGIDVCSNNNTVKANQIYSSTEAGIKVDNRCTEGTSGGLSGNGNTITNNSIVGGCAGILEGTGTGNTVSPNTFLVDVTTSIVAGDVCTSETPETKTVSIPAAHGAGHTVPFR